MSLPLEWTAPETVAAPEETPLEFADTEQTHYIFGFWLFLASDIVLFSCLFASFLVYRGENLNMGSLGVVLPINLTTVMTETVLLLTSSFTCSLAVHELRRHRVRGVVTLLAITLALGAAFVTLEVRDFVGLVASGYNWGQNSFLSAFFTLVGTHGGHVTFGILWGIAIIIQLLVHGLGTKTARKVYTFALYWHFLDIVWVFIFTVVYLSTILK